MKSRPIGCICFWIVFWNVVTGGGVGASDYDWPQWRGPERTDVSSETDLLESWPEGGPKRVWMFKDAGVGYSGPAVSGEQLFTIGSRDGSERLIALNFNTGEELWSAEMGENLENNWGDGPRGTPTVDGEHVYALSGQGNLVCAKVADGTVVWKVAMSDFGGKTPSWGYTESVLVDGNQVVCTPGGDDGAIVALNKMTGEKLWQSNGVTDGAQYSSIMPVTLNGRSQYVQLFQASLVSVAADTGELLWSSEWPGKVAVIPTPIPHENFIYVTSGYGVGCKLVKVSDTGDVEDVYDNKIMKNHHGGVVLVDGYLYGHSDGVGWVCQVFKTGQKAWSEKDALGKGAVTYADGHLYCVEEDSGIVALVEATPDGWKEKSRFTLDPQTEIRKSDGRVWTHPVVVNGRLLLRDQDLIYCYDVSAATK